jgi:hypothetical protein
VRRVAWLFVLLALAALSLWLSGGLAPWGIAPPSASDAAPAASGDDPEAVTPSPPATVRVAAPRDARLDADGRPAARGVKRAVAHEDGAAAEASAGPFAGIVVDEQDAPVPGATVEVVSGWSRELRRGLFPEESPEPVTTGADGRFSFALAKPMNRIDVLARAPHLVADRSDAPVLPGVEARVRMLVGREILVSVLDPAGRPVEGAEVVLVDDPGEFVEWRREDAVDRRFRTRSDGRVTVLTRRWDVNVVARKEPWCAVSRTHVPVPPDGAALEMRFLAGGAIAGVVRSSQGAPIAGALVELMDTDGLDVAFTSDRSKEDGTFLLTDVPADDRRARGLQPDFLQVQARSAGRWEGAYVDRPEPGETQHVVIVVGDSRRIDGVVVDPTGTPVKDAGVRPGEEAFDPPRGVEARATTRGLRWTDGAGRFDLPWFAPDETAVTACVRIDDVLHCGTAKLDPSRAQETVRIVVRATDDRRASLDVQVRVATADGAPIAHAILEAGTLSSLAVREPMILLDKRETDEQGIATLRNLPEGTVTLVVHPPGGTAFTTTLPVGGHDVRTVRIPSGEIAGTIVGLDGHPLRLSLVLDAQVRDGHGSPTKFEGAARTRADGQGRFRFTGLGDGEYLIRSGDEAFEVLNAHAPAKSGDASSRLVAVRAEDRERLVIGGEWTDAVTGAPVHLRFGTFVLESAPDGFRGREIAFSPFGEAGSGRTSSEPVLPGTYSGIVRMYGYADHRTTVRVPDGRQTALIRARLEPGGLIEGTVRRDDGRPLVGRVEVVCNDRRAHVDSGGAFSLTGPFEEEVCLRVDADWLRGHRSVSVSRGGTAHGVDLVVEPAGAIALRLPDGRVPAHRVVATVWRVDGPNPMYAPTLEIDRAWLAANPPSRTLGGLAPGRYRVDLAWDGEALPERTVDVVAGVTVPIDVSKP